MSNKFGVKEYITLIKLFKSSGFKIKGFKERRKTEKVIILRHDVDYSPDLALKLAIIENKLKVSSTYFFLVSSDFYNIYSEKNLAILKQIICLGHTIGLHFDASFYKQKELDFYCNYEARVLEKACNAKINMVSFHRPIKKLLNSNKKIGRLNHTYMKEFFSDMVYCSDSEGRWRFEKPHKIISENKNKEKFYLQLLTHPIWWTTPSDLSPVEKLNFFVKKESKNKISLLEKNSKPFKKRNNL